VYFAEPSEKSGCSPSSNSPANSPDQENFYLFVPQKGEPNNARKSIFRPPDRAMDNLSGILGTRKNPLYTGRLVRLKVWEALEPFGKQISAPPTVSCGLVFGGSLAGFLGGREGFP